ncbi:MAG: SDR family oxidoreductase [Deltaproteobacteria bacterium]|jgi:NAD(P)-dependent dehydrogenase (short-subunit alcohol dehydrogenase family)|nr:SDR family oxidoreductase [Deltaproteobacteria bacterium]MBW2496629.1 SDR family oxidoreductase [Deltaproteobacteria bacterium]
MGRFDDHVFLLTGASSGIGRATSIRLASEGASLFLGDIASEALEETAKTAEQAGAQVTSRVFDVSDETQVREAVAACIERYGRLDTLCNIAGVIQGGHTKETSFETWRRILSVNLDGTFLMTREALPHLLETRGAIINIGSTAGLMGLPYGAAYGASKGGVHAFTRAVAVEYAKQGLRCNAICPGSIKTPMSNPGFPEDVDMTLVMRSASLQGTRGPEVVANLIAFLASDEAIHINGEEIRIDGAALA